MDSCLEVEEELADGRGAEDGATYLEELDIDGETDGVDLEVLGADTLRAENEAFEEELADVGVNSVSFAEGIAENNAADQLSISPLASWRDNRGGIMANF